MDNNNPTLATVVRPPAGANGNAAVEGFREDDLVIRGIAEGVIEHNIIMRLITL